MYTLGVGFNHAYSHLADGFIIYNKDKKLFMCDNVIYEVIGDKCSPWTPLQKDIISKDWRLTYERQSFKPKSNS